jgi:hypothetical protein
MTKSSSGGWMVVAEVSMVVIAGPPLHGRTSQLRSLTPASGDTTRNGAGEFSARRQPVLGEQIAD